MLLALVGFAAQTSTIDARGMCSGSLNFGNDQRIVCGGYSTSGCQVSKKDEGFIKCVDGTVLNSGSGLCESSRIVPTFVGEGERCDPSTSVQFLCDHNLACVDRVCRKTLAQGDACFLGSQLGCGRGLVCDGDRCVGLASQEPGEICKVDATCKYGVCSNVCLDRRNIACLSDAQCPDGEVCDIELPKERGICTSNIHISKVGLASCERVVIVIKQTKMTLLSASHARQSLSNLFAHKIARKEQICDTSMIVVHLNDQSNHPKHVTTK